MLLKPIFLTLFFCSCTSVIGSPPEYIKDCMNCHGEQGVSTASDIPTIAGASATFIEETLYSYIEDMRPAIESKYCFGDINREATDMKKIAQQLTEEQITEVAKYFAEQSFVAAKQEFDTKLATIGKKIHDKKCNKCHEEGGSSAADDAGILAGQWMPYLRDSMNNIINDTRVADKKMKKKIKKLKEIEWQALLHFYASQQG